MVHLYKGLKTTLQVLGLLLFSMATSFCSYAQDKNLDNLEDLDGLIDELFFNDQQFLDELLESDFSYNFLYTSLSYNSNTYFSGRDSGTDQYNIIPQVSYYHSSGFNASISGIYYQNFAPSWDFTSLSVGYFNTLGVTENITYNLGYTRFLYSDDYDVFTNSLDVSLGIRNIKRTIGSTLAVSYIFGTDQSYQIVSNTYANINLKRKPNFALRLRPNISFVIANQSITFDVRRLTASGYKTYKYTQNVFDLLNTQISFPMSLSTNSWDFELGYNLNLPNALANEPDVNITSFFNLSVGYMFDLNKK
ncbi:hypothetical protein KO506_15410 [Polaribacter vadi]|uniref:hypothetical protein n=1 Tax=Polaribacter TaxID=52959 RepID=UPI001C096817|nr:MULTISPECIES: hypothetical protein [Polaribacter]MBU3012801.1 hypothetical protein [Polaribacter vadi]MDO6742617.1 hypothetical protein [Polaribacter sp. 1_MG-2023]